MNSVHYWRFSDGEPRENPIMEPQSRGWRCWVYNAEDTFNEWMNLHCPSAHVERKFNSGNPVHLVFIPNDREAMMFALKWL